MKPIDGTKIPRSTLCNKLFGERQGYPGYPTTLRPEDEQAKTGVLSKVENWGFALMSHDMAGQICPKTGQNY